MTIEEVSNNENIDFTGIPSSYYLLGLISAFENRFQALADSMMKEISWKQFFAIICINMCKEPLLKLEKKNFIEFKTDESDRRKQRIHLTEHCKEFSEKNNEMSISVMSKMFEGISEDSVRTTIQTLTDVEKNLKDMFNGVVND